jgi:hypothetical protein
MSTLSRLHRAAVVRWRQLHGWLTRERLRRIGVVAGVAAIVAIVAVRIIGGGIVGVIVWSLAVTVLVLAAFTLLGVVIFMNEELVDEFDATDPMRARDGGAFGPRIKRFFGNAIRGIRADLSSAPEGVAALRKGVTRNSVARFAHASAEALGGVPPADVPPPRSAGHLARPDRAPEPPEPEPTARERGSSRSIALVGQVRGQLGRFRHRAATAVAVRRSPEPATGESTSSDAPRRSAPARSARRLRRTGRSDPGARRAPRFGRMSNAGGRRQR